MNSLAKKEENLGGNRDSLNDPTTPTSLKSLNMTNVSSLHASPTDVLPPETGNVTCYTVTGLPEVGRARVLDELTKLSPIDYQAQRKSAAGQFGIGVKTLDAEVAFRRRTNPGEIPSKAALVVPLEPWPDPVDGGELLDLMTKAISERVVMTVDEAQAVALWDLASHSFDAFDLFPRLGVMAPEKGCGKSTLLDVISCLVDRPLYATSVSAASIFRLIGKARPTLLMDEIDTYLGRNDDLRNVLNSGFEKTGGTMRCVGDNHEPTRFSTYTPIVYAGIGKVPLTVADRSIRISLKRKMPGQAVLSSRQKDLVGVREHGRMAARWARDNREAIETSPPPLLPECLQNREADVWEPLIKIADQCGDHWPSTARQVAIRMSTESSDGRDSIATTLLGEFKRMFLSTTKDYLAAVDLLELNEDEGNPWATWHDGKGINDADIAKILKPFGISKTVQRVSPKETARVYMRESFIDAFARYLTDANLKDAEAGGFFETRPEANENKLKPLPVYRKLSDFDVPEDESDTEDLDATSSGDVK